MEDIAEELARRDRFLRNRSFRMTPEQRIDEMRQLQRRAWEILRSSPKGYASFIARNFKQRAIDISSADA